MHILLKGCLAAGIALIAAGSVITAFDYERTLRGGQTAASDSWPEKRALPELEGASAGRGELEGLRRLKLELSGGELHLATGSEPMLQIGEKLLPHIRYEIKDGALSLRDTLGERWWKGLRDWDEGYSVFLVLPEGSYESVDISLGAGEGFIQGLTADRITVDSGAGEMQLNDLWAQDMELSCGAGEFTGYGIHVSQDTKIGCGVGELALAGDLRGNVEVSGGVGQIALKLAGAQEEYSISVGAGMGSVKVGDRTVSMFTGELQEQRENAENQLDISCGVGEIDIQFSENIDKTV